VFICDPLTWGAVDMCISGSLQVIERKGVICVFHRHRC
jgi:hypothetical protein